MSTRSHAVRDHWFEVGYEDDEGTFVTQVLARDRDDAKARVPGDALWATTDMGGV